MVISVFGTMNESGVAVCEESACLLSDNGGNAIGVERASANSDKIWGDFDKML